MTLSKSLGVPGKALAVALAAFVLALGAWSWVQAAPPQANKPLSVYDANGVFLGNLASISPIMPETGPQKIVTYLSGQDAILMWNEGTPSEILLTPRLGYDVHILYTGDNCTGTAYVDQASEHLLRQTIVNWDGVPHRLLPPTQTIETISQVVSGSCVYNPSPVETFKSALEPITLPFNINAVASPLRVDTN